MTPPGDFTGQLCVEGTPMRPLALVLFLAASAVTLGCGPAVKCGPGNCSGCCDSSGACQTGTTNVACGNGGLICNACFVG